MPNTNVIKSTINHSVPFLPATSISNIRRITTKHFTNLPLWLPYEDVALINWLVYQLNADNTFKYDTFMIVCYSNSIVFAGNQYNVKVKHNISSVYIRKTFKHLIECGLIIKTDRDKIYMINPMLTYSADVVSVKKYKEVMAFYNRVINGDETLLSFAQYFTKLVATYMESKKKNYKYGKSK